jgi:hypothetical protein
MAIAAEDNVTHTRLCPPSPPPAHMCDTAPQRPRDGIPTLPTKQVACLQADCRAVDSHRHSGLYLLQLKCQHRCQST